MDITGEYRIAASKEQVWQALNDPEMLKQCIPGCEELEKVSDTEINAKVVAKIGPVKAKFDTQLELANLDPPNAYTLIGESKGGAAGFGRGSADVTLEEDGDLTVLRYKADFKVGGKLAQVGSRLVVAATRKTADDFFSAFSTRLDPHAQKVLTEDEKEAIEAGKRTKVMAATVAALVAILILLWILLS